MLSYVRMSGRQNRASKRYGGLSSNHKGDASIGSAKARGRTHLGRCCEGTKRAVIWLLTCDRPLVAFHPSVTGWQTDAMETNNHEILIWGVYQVQNFNVHIPVDFNPLLAAAIPKYSATGSRALPAAHSALRSCSGGLLGTEWTWKRWKRRTGAVVVSLCLTYTAFIPA